MYSNFFPASAKMITVEYTSASRSYHRHYKWHLRRHRVPMRFFFHLEALKCLWVNWLSTWTVVVFIGNANQGHRCIVTHGSSRCVSKTLSIKAYSILICHDHNCIFLVYFLISTEGTLRRPIICANSVVRLKSVLRALVMGCGATHHCRQHHFRFEIIWKGPWCSFSFLLKAFLGHPQLQLSWVMSMNISAPQTRTT